MPFRDVRNMYMNAWMILLFSLACQYSCDLDLYVKSSMILTWQMRMNTMHERYSGIKRYLIYNLVFVRLHTIHGATMRCQNEHHTIQLSTQAQIPILVLRWCNHMSRIQEKNDPLFICSRGLDIPTMFCFISWEALRINLLSRCPNVLATQVYNNLQISARRMQNYNPEIHDLPFHHVTIGQSQASSGARVAIVTVPSEDLREAMTMFQICRATQVPVPRYIDARQARYASTWWMQPWWACHDGHDCHPLTWVARFQFLTFDLVLEAHSDRSIMKSNEHRSQLVMHVCQRELE